MKSRSGFFDKFHPSKPNTIFIKVHLSADSLPRKQLSVENSALFSVWFLCPSGGGQVRLAVLLKRKGGGDLGVLAKCFVRLLLTAAASSCHLHSTDTPEFWDEEDEDGTGGSASVSMTAAVRELEDGEEEEEEEAATALSLSFFFMRFRLLSIEATSDLRER